MGAFDQAARYATDADPQPVLHRLMRRREVAWRFRDWHPSQTTPRPEGRSDRTADLVAHLDNLARPELPWLMVLEFQAQADPEKLEVTLEEAIRFRMRARHGPDQTGRFAVLVGMVYLVDEAETDQVLDMTLPDGVGTRHQPLAWRVGQDSANEALDAVENGSMSWGLLFWVPLMLGAEDPTLVLRWMELATAKADSSRLGDLKQIALLFAELAKRRQVWVANLKGWNVQKSELLEEWTAEARLEGRLESRREDLRDLIETKFPGCITPDIVKCIDDQPSAELLRVWLHAAIAAARFEDFLAVLAR